MVDKNKIVEEPVVEVIRKVCDRFVAASRAFDSKNKVREGKMVRTYNGAIILFPNGRWTTDKDVQKVIPYDCSGRYHTISYNGAGRKINTVEVEQCLNALVSLGVVSPTDAVSFRLWRWKYIDFTLTEERIARLKKDLAEEEEELAKILTR